MHYSGGMCSQKCKFLDPCITMEECVANILIFWTHALQWRNVQPKKKIFGPMHYNGGMCSLYIKFLDQCITVEECVAEIMHYRGEICSQYFSFQNHTLQLRNVWVAEYMNFWTHAKFKLLATHFSSLMHGFQNFHFLLHFPPL